jgi:hypothetical protein
VFVFAILKNLKEEMNKGKDFVVVVVVVVRAFFSSSNSYIIS